MKNILILNPPISIRHPLSLPLKISLKTFLILSLILAISLLVLYIFQVNLLTSQIYFLAEAERKFTEIKKENENLEISFSKANSLANIENYFQSQGFEKAKGVKYIKILESQVVTK